ncbi:MAG: galactose mutarotase [Propionibacteriaceae bacterium]|jgi:aldose 1-epimerase|nr:galactose mutarotase [Propionibacteriaceae bacterium]
MQDTYWLRNRALAVKIARFGASIQRFEVAGRNITLSRPDPAQTSPQYLGATCGRYANRIAGGSFQLDGTSYQLDQNEGPNTLHGGKAGFSEHRWDEVSATDGQVVLALVSPDGDQGFPGQLEAQAIFTLLDSGLQLEYRATTDAPTVLNLTCHPYFNLNGDGVGDANDHLVQLNASGYTAVGDDLIPTGEIADVTDTALDFRQPRVISEARADLIAQGLAAGEGYDHNFVVDGEGLREHLILTGPDGLRLRLLSDAPCVQLYDGANFDGSPTSREGRPYTKYAGLAVEPQLHPDAPNHPNFPSAVLRPDEEYRRTIQYLIEQDQD